MIQESRSDIAGSALEHVADLSDNVEAIKHFLYIIASTGIQIGPAIR